MSNGRVAALSEGLTYQGIIFWQYAFKMLLTDNEIACVTYEEQKASPCDDVVVYYTKTLQEENLSCYDVEYMQCKFKVDDSNSIKFLDLMDPNYYGNNESFFKRAYVFYKSLGKESVRLSLYTTVNQDSTDEIFKKISKINNALKIDELLRKTIFKSALNEMQKHLEASEEEVLDFLAKLRFYFGKSVEQEREQLSFICKSLGVVYDRSKMGDSLSDILRKMNLAKKTNFTQDIIKTICINNELFTKRENHLGIVSNNWQDGKTVEALSKSNVLNLTEYFDGRLLKYNCAWKNVRERINNFCNSLKFNENYLITLSASYSVCFACGKQIGQKNANITFNNKTGVWSEKLYEKSVNKDQNELVLLETDNPIDNVVLVFSFDGDIIEDVKDYLKEINFSNYGILVQKNTSEERIISNNRFWEGVLSFCVNAKEFIKRKKPEKTHLFYRGPAEGAFVIGQYAKEWGECTVYEFNFDATPREQKYIKGITI